MTLGDILRTAAQRDLSAVKPGTISYIELIKDGKFYIKLSSKEDRDAFVECYLPNEGTEDEKNYLRAYFLSLVYHAAIFGMKRKKSKKIK